MAPGSLSPKQILERTQHHRQAVMVLALMRAKKAVERELQSRGLKAAGEALVDIARSYAVSHSTISRL